MDGKAIGARVAQVRKARIPLLSQEALSVLAGVTRLTVNNLELGKTREPDYTTVSAIAAALDVTVTWLIEGDTPSQPTLDTSTADDVPTDQDEAFRRAAEYTGTGEDGIRALRAVRRSIGPLSEEAMVANLKSWKAHQATEGLAFAKDVDKAQAEPSRLPAGAMKARPIKRKG